MYIYRLDVNSEFVRYYKLRNWVRVSERISNKNWQPPTDTLVLAELVLAWSLEFYDKHYQQVGGVAMETKMEPNYACLFDVERKMLKDYKGNRPQLCKRYIDDRYTWRILWHTTRSRELYRILFRLPPFPQIHLWDQRVFAFFSRPLPLHIRRQDNYDHPLQAHRCLELPWLQLITSSSLQESHAVSFSVFEGSAQTMIRWVRG